eukprot:TRINITY_DN6683_c0_g1_i1.p1 TRINITY_DN6683_c0_g1~~TRINITY_DN6683_c0_g1_i1.p1  ORF type:complete len:276 (+),score=48.78 TRINITY_DN6683_c0_g1_i1:90-917(+)
MPAVSQVILILSTVSAAGQAQEDTCEGDGCSVEFLQRGLQFDATKTKTQLQLPEKDIEIKGGFDCFSYPAFCAEPFNCQTYGPRHLTMDAAIAKGGNPDLQSWCAMPQYHEYVSQCVVEKDLMKAGRTQYENTKAGKHGKDTFQMDGSLCFIEGHCLNQAVHQDTTLDEAAAQCDDRFGHAEWTSMGDPQNHVTMNFLSYSSKIHNLNQSLGFPGPEYARGYTLLACAMGNYHCDVMYCKETYCKDPEMIQKYRHFLQDIRWTNNTEKWFVGASK